MALRIQIMATQPGRRSVIVVSDGVAQGQIATASRTWSMISGPVSDFAITRNQATGWGGHSKMGEITIGTSGSKGASTNLSVAAVAFDPSTV